MALILASGSPRRRELLEKLGLDFRVMTLEGIDESHPASLHGEDIARYISSKKAEAYRSVLLPEDIVITADTIVCVKGTVLGKPNTPGEARKMLQSLSGVWHQVITGVTLLSATRSETFAVTTDVKFATLTDWEINHYITHYHPFDKAGSYGIQEWMGLVAVEELRGSYFNVMGLPVCKLYHALRDFMGELPLI